MSLQLLCIFQTRWLLGYELWSALPLQHHPMNWWDTRCAFPKQASQSPVCYLEGWTEGSKLTPNTWEGRAASQWSFKRMTAFSNPSSHLKTLFLSSISSPLPKRAHENNCVRPDNSALWRKPQSVCGAVSDEEAELNRGEIQLHRARGNVSVQRTSHPNKAFPQPGLGHRKSLFWWWKCSR